MTDGYDFDIVDDDLLLDDKGGWEGGSGSGDRFWAYPTNKDSAPKTLYFVADFWDDPNHAWGNWRECFAREGLVGGIELDGGLKGIPVRDTRLLANGRRVNISENDPDYDQLLKLVVPYADPKYGRNVPERPVSDKGGVNVVEVAPGGELYHKVLVLTRPRMRALKNRLKGQRQMDPNFTVIGKQFVLAFVGHNRGEVDLGLNHGAPPIELPEPINIYDALQARREAVFSLVESWTGVATEAYAIADAAAAVEAQATAEDLAVGEEGFTNPILPEITGVDYTSMTDARLKTLLMKKGVTVAPKTPREELIALATEHGVG